MTYELVHFATLHADDTFTFRGEEISGRGAGRRRSAATCSTT